MSTFSILFVISTGLKLWILGLGVVRNLLADFRWFFIFIIYSLIESVVRSAFFHGGQGYFNDRIYFRVYWISETLDLTLLGMAVRESFSRTLHPFSQLRWVRIIFWICVSLPLLYSLWKATVEPPARAGLLVSAIIGIEITMQYLVVAIVLLYLTLVRLFNIRGHLYESGIVLGFGANASMSGLGYLIRSIFGTKFPLLYGWLTPLGFVIAEAIWVGVLLRGPGTKTVPPAISLTPDEIIRQLDRYMQLMKRLISKR